jgi:ketosteroid isomerase-like protein
MAGRLGFEAGRGNRVGWHYADFPIPGSAGKLPQQAGDIMAATSRDMTTQIERYFAAVDAADAAGILATLAPDCVLEIVTAGTRSKGRRAIREMLEERFRVRAPGWHGEFAHATDPARGLAASRLRVRSVARDGTVNERHNVNVFEFKGRLFRRVQIRSG